MYSDLIKDSQSRNFATLKDITSICKDVWKPCLNQIIEYYSIPAFDKNNFPDYSDSSAIKSNKILLKNEMVLVSKLNPRTKRIWRPLCLTKTCVASTEFICFVPNTGYYSFLNSVVNSSQFIDYLSNNAIGTTNSRQRVKPSDALKYSIIIPTNDKLDLFNKITTPLLKLIDVNILENQCLKSLRETLLPKLMSGEIDVSKLDSYD